MSEELGKVEKPSVEEFSQGRKLYLVPLLYSGAEPPAEYVEKLEKYWQQVEEQVRNLETKLGQVKTIYHELISLGGEEGCAMIEQLNDRGYRAVKSRVDGGATLEATEDGDLVAEFMDWGRCLAIRLQSQKAFTTVYESYTAAGKKRNEFIIERINGTLGSDGIGLLFMSEGHQLQFPSDIQVFYVSPPALDEIKRWLREFSARSAKEAASISDDEPATDNNEVEQS